VPVNGGRISPPAPVLSTDITVDYPQKKGVLRGARIEVFPRETLGLVGQSGSGKSTLALAILRLLDHTGARIRGRTILLGHDLTAFKERQLRDIRGRLVSLIPQSPAAALSPSLRIGTQLREAWRAHSSEPWASQQHRVTQLFATAGLAPAETFLNRFPSEISVGQAQRVLIVMALLHSPPLLIADEPTTSLDAITQREVLDLLVRMGQERNMSMLFISHDLLTVAAVCHRLAILYEGEIVECAPVERVLTCPEHPYTKQLLAAFPVDLRTTQLRRQRLSSQEPYQIDLG
jgi:ABC-type dipeptide/oligopeptide/nickel transport system ATPase component